MKRTQAGPERSTTMLVLRVLTIAAFTAAAGHLFVGPSQLPGSSAALFALAVPFAIGGWVFHVVGSGRPSFRRDVFLGVAGGAVICAIVGLLR